MLMRNNYSEQARQRRGGRQNSERMTKSIEIACGISDVWAGSMYWLSSKWSEQIWYELYNCFAVFEPRSPDLVFMTHLLDLLKHNDVAAREEVV